MVSAAAQKGKLKLKTGKMKWEGSSNPTVWNRLMESCDLKPFWWLCRSVWGGMRLEYGTEL